jgi:NADP-dependent 3-hydroxy acid dehydrogenase YdfG
MSNSKTWMITGAARGFGRIWTEAALARGDRVVATARKLSALDDLVAEYGDRILPVALDVTDRAAVFAAVKQAHAHFGRLDVVISNAGFGIFGAIEEAGIEDIRANFETNVFGTLNLIQAVLPILRAQGSGHIIPVSSGAGLIGVPNAGIYNGAKFAVEGIGEALAAEVAGFGIKVTLIEPGAYATNFLSETSLTSSKTIPAYDGVRAALAEVLKDDVAGDPMATVPAIMQVVDSENPPMRLILGTLLPMIRGVYEQRLQTWEDWDDVARAAKGLPGTN